MTTHATPSGAILSPTHPPPAHTVLLTGGAGFIGANFARLALARGDCAVVVLDALTYSGNRDNLLGLEDQHPGRYAFLHADVCDRAALDAALRRVRPTSVVHMAAESHVDRSLLDATPFVRTNVLGTQTLIDALRAFNADAARPVRLVHVSTDEVYGSLPLDRPDLRFTEQTPLSPRSPYAASKAASDMLVLAAAHTFGVDAVVTRCSNNLGPYQFPEKVIPLFVTNLLEGRRVPLYGDGLNVRDWIHVEDHCRGVLAAMERGRSGEVYNFGAGNERSNLELTHAVLGLLGRDASFIEPVPDRLGHDRRYAVDSSKAERELGWKPTRSAWPDALRETVAWYRENEAWWRRVKSGEYRLDPAGRGNTAPGRSA